MEEKYFYLVINTKPLHLNLNQYFKGGYDDSKPGIGRDNILKFNLQTEEWEEVGKMIEGRVYPAASLVPSPPWYNGYCNIKKNGA